MSALPWVMIGKRLLATIPILLGVTFLVVASTELIPGSPAEKLSARGTMSAEQIREIEHLYGWDQPLPIRFLRYVGNVTRGDLGVSIHSKRAIAEEILEKVPATLELTAAAMLLAVILGVSIGVIAALRPFTLIDYGSMIVALIGISFPVFWLGLIMQIAIFPSTQRIDFEFEVQTVTGLYLIDTAFWGEPGAFLSSLKHLILPATALCTIPLAVIARMTRASMMEVLTKDYVRTARAKGLASQVVVVKHALRNALIPVVTIAGIQFASLLGGAVLTETVFQWPGLGKYIYTAAFNEDLPALQGAVLFVALVFTVINLAVDVSYGLIDPRIRSGGGE